MSLAAVLSFAAAVAAQDPALAGGGWRWHPVADGDATVLALRWWHGLDDDAAVECGAAAALGEYRLLRAQSTAAADLASGLRVGDDETIVWVLAPAARTTAAIAFCRALLDDGAPIDDDLARRAIARAALAADDADWLYPGTVLAGRARRALWSGAGAHGVAGSATAIQPLTPSRLRELMVAPVRVEGLGLGAITAELRQAVEALPLRWAPIDPPATQKRQTPPHGIDVQLHPRADGPIAAVAFAVEGGCSWQALAVGVEVARMRAAVALPLRGPEARARAPVVLWSPVAAEPVLLLCRRGRDGDAPDRAFAELDALIADLRHRPPTVAECDSARRAVQWEAGLAPLPPGTDGAALPGRAVALLVAERSAAELAAVTPAAAHAALVAVCDPGAAWRGALVPVPPASSR